MIIKKRQLLMATLIVALGAAVFVNWYYTKPESLSTGVEVSVTATETDEESAKLGEARYVISSEVTEAENKTAEYFAGARLKRQSAHDEAAEMLNAVIGSADSDAQAVKDATEKLNELAENLVLEGDTENLITAKLNCETIVTINGDAAQVIVEKGKLDSAGAVQIQEIMLSQTGFDSKNITIIELNS